MSAPQSSCSARGEGRGDDLRAACACGVRTAVHQGSARGRATLAGAAWLIVLLWFATLQGAFAFELQRADPQFVDREYRFEMTALLDAPIDDVERILRDYENYTTLDARILDAKVLERPADGVAILATTLRACFGPVCRSVRRVERVEESPRVLLAVTDPTRSDMKFGETRMELTTAGDAKTQVTYRTRLRPDFWIPALVARGMMLDTLEDATIELFRSVERQAQEK